MKRKREFAAAAGAAFALIALVWFLASRDFLASRGGETKPDTESGDKSAAEMHPQTAVLPAAPFPTPSHPAGFNAADLYKDAFVLFNALTDEEKKMLLNPREEVDADKADALFKKIQPIMDLLRKARLEAAYCDWGMGTDWSQGMQGRGQVLLLGRNLGLAARWDAAYLIPSDPAGAITGLADQAYLAHNVGSQFMIGFGVESSLVQTAASLIRDNTASLTPEALSQALNLLQNSTFKDDFSRAMNAEADGVASQANQLLNPGNPKSNGAVFSGENTAPSSQFEDLTPEESTAMGRQYAQLAQFEREYAQKGVLPNSEFEAWLAQVNSQADSQPMIAPTLSAINGMRTSYQTAAVNNSMLATGLAILQSGPAQLATQTDPTTGQPFTYVETPNGFELQSTFQSKGKPVMMTFLNPAK